MEAWFRRQFNRIERETQLNLHKVTHFITVVDFFLFQIPGNFNSVSFINE